MKPEQYFLASGHENGHQPFLQKLHFLKVLIIDSWFALGNVLLLIGGDDSVEIRFTSLTSLTLHQAAIPVSGNDFKGGCL
jgi:hypothetical protein